MSVLRGLLIALTMVSVIAALTSTTWANPRVVVVVSDDASRRTSNLGSAMARLRAELETAGFQVLTQLVPDPAPSAPSLEEIGRTARSFAAILISAVDDGIVAQVSVTDPVNDKTLLRVVRAPEEGVAASSVVALRAVELLQASLVELDLPLPHDNEADLADLTPNWDPNHSGATEEVEIQPPLAPAVIWSWRNWPDQPFGGGPSGVPAELEATHRGHEVSAEAKERPRWFIAVGGGALGGPGGLGLGVVPMLGVGRRLSRLIVAEASAIGPATAELEGDLGTAQLDQELGVVRFRLDPGGRDHTIAPLVGAGLGAYRLGGHGSASPPNRGQTDSAWAAVAVASLGVRTRVSSALALLFHVDGFVPVPRPTVRFAGGTMVRAPFPGVVGSTAVELRL